MYAGVFKVVHLHVLLIKTIWKQRDSHQQGINRENWYTNAAQYQPKNDYIDLYF